MGDVMCHCLGRTVCDRESNLNVVNKDDVMFDTATPC